MNGSPMGQVAMRRQEALARHTDEPGKMTRLYLSPMHKRAVEELSLWMTAAGMRVSVDALGSLIGRYEGAAKGAPAVLIGSHIDTVRDAGIYDGIFGVIAGIAAVEELNRAGERLPFAIEVIAFGDEEGVRFPTTLSGSRGLAGTFDRKLLDVLDGEGVSLRDALRAFGCDPDRVAQAAKAPADVLAYVEVHIEQGPVLEAEGLAVGVVTTINGASRYAIEVGGMAGHAGTVPMNMRRDALAAAAEMILAVERRAAAEADMVATVGRVEALPGATNVIPGAARFTIDLRSPDDRRRQAACADLERELAASAKRRGITLSMRKTHDAPAAACAPGIMAGLAAVMERHGHKKRALPSGAGHDAMAMTPLCPIGMLFVRCAGGISHNPAEAMTAEDADCAIRILLDYLRAFDPAAARQGWAS